MKKVFKFISIIIVTFLLFIIVVICYDNYWSDIDFEEEDKLCLFISEDEDISKKEPRSLTSFIMDSPEDLLQYLHQRESYLYFDYLPFEGNLVMDSLDFENYDYVFSEGHPILRMKKLLWDECTSYESDTLTPLFFEFGAQISRKVYIYKIKPKNKYRKECG